MTSKKEQQIDGGLPTIHEKTKVDKGIISYPSPSLPEKNVVDPQPALQFSHDIAQSNMAA